MHTIIQVVNDSEYAAAALLFKEYATWLNIDLGFQNFDHELNSLKDVYAQPLGGIFLLKNNTSFVGSIAFKPLAEHTAELKRMYVQPAFRNQGYAVLLLTKAEHTARAAGYKYLKLDTLSSMVPAMEFYKKNGFTETEPYYYNPNSNTVYFEKRLA